MTAGTYNLTIEAGATFTKVFTWNSPTAVNLTGYTARAHIRGHIEAAGAALLELTTENARIVLGGVAGTITLKLTAAETAALTWTSGAWDLEMISGPGIVTRLLEGVATVRGNVTR